MVVVWMLERNELYTASLQIFSISAPEYPSVRVANSSKFNDSSVCKCFV